MNPLVGAAIIGAGSSLLGGMMSDKSSAEAANNNAAMQQRFAQHGIRWKMEDAKRAGISPEYALGASTHSFQPTYTGGQMGNAVADAGQNIARAALASSSAPDRQTDAALKAETLRGMKLDNDIKASQFTSVNRPGNPAFPDARGNMFPGQGNSPVKDVKLERTGQDPRNRHSEGGSLPSVGWAETADGGLRPIPSQDIKNRIEDQAIPETLWAAQHLIAPNVSMGPKPPQSALPKGYSGWSWSYKSQAYYPTKTKYGSAGKARDWFEKAKREANSNPYLKRY